ncbi:MAG: amidohydrolase [Bacillota bacterium]|nr:amidohydrolase [Bacillota bacterium]MDW7678446.1 amidohydrolase [Bacillota bacterium]
MDSVIKCGAIATGDGSRLLYHKALWVKDGVVADITGVDEIPAASDIRIIDAESWLVAPGAVNYHTHGCAAGPLYPSGAEPLPRSRVIGNIRRHLSQGTTTICNVCGFSRFSDIEGLKEETGANLCLTTAHTPASLKAAEMVDGKGLTDAHKTMTVQEMAEQNAVAVGESGGGHTLGGGGQDYLYIPQAILQKTNVTINTFQAKALKLAVLSRYMDFSGFNRTEVDHLLREYGLQHLITPEETAEIIRKSVMTSIGTALEGFDETMAAARETGLPVIYHTSAPSVKKIEELLLRNRREVTVVAAHCNHDTFEVEEAVIWAERLKALGAVIDLGTFDITEQSQQFSGVSPEYFDRLGESGLADIISTDYNGGYWDGVYEGMSRLVRKGFCDIPRAIAMGTGNVRKAIPRIAPRRGLIQKGFHADFVITDPAEISHIKEVYINGLVAWSNTTPTKKEGSE